MTDMKELVKGIPNCPCGKEHTCPTETVEIGSGVLPKIVELCAGYEKILLVADQNTYHVCCAEVERLLGAKVEGKVVYQSGDKPLIPNEEALATLEAAVTENTQLIVGVGSGVTNDLCKQVSFVKDLPYYIVATAPSMDGYASVGAALILKGMKITLITRPPKAVIADTRVLKSAPLEMIQSGSEHHLSHYFEITGILDGAPYFCHGIDVIYSAVVTANS